MARMRDTKYATEQRTTRVGENLIERLFIKAHKQVEIRVSWWPGGRMANRPLDVTEVDFVTLIAQGIADGVTVSGTGEGGHGATVVSSAQEPRAAV